MSLTQIAIILVFTFLLLLRISGYSNICNRSNAFRWLVLIILIIISASRPKEMADYENYVAAFTYYGTLRFEPAFTIIRYIAQLFSCPATIGLLFFAIIAVLIKGFAIKKFKIPFIDAIIIYLTYIYVAQDLVAIRSGAAASVLLMALYYRNDNIIKSVCLFLFAIMFHFSAIFFIIIYFISPHKLNRLLYLALIAFSYFYYIFDVQLINNIINQFYSVTTLNILTYTVNEINALNLLQLGHTFVCVVMWMRIKKLQYNNNKTILLLKLYTIAVCLVPILADFIQIALRSAELFYTVELLLIPIAFKSLFSSKTLNNMSFIMYSIVMFYLVINDLAYWNPDML